MGKDVEETLFASTAAALDLNPGPTKSTAYATTQERKLVSNSTTVLTALVGESAKVNTACTVSADLRQSTSFSTQS